MYENPRQVLDAWLDGVNSGNLDSVMALYSENAVLLPTFSNRRFAKPADLRGYFEQLGTYKNLSVELRKRTVVEQELNAHLYSLGGIYCWHFEVDEEIMNFEARFTFTVDLNLDAPILHHHSSQVPRML